MKNSSSPLHSNEKLTLCLLKIEDALGTLTLTTTQISGAVNLVILLSDDRFPRLMQSHLIESTSTSFPLNISQDSHLLPLQITKLTFEFIFVPPNLISPLKLPLVFFSLL